MMKTIFTLEENTLNEINLNNIANLPFKKELDRIQPLISSMHGIRE